MKRIENDDIDLRKPAVDNLLLSIVGANYTQRDKRLVVASLEAQLESCEKEKTKEINALLTECKEYHDAVIRGIFEGIQATGVLRWHEYNEEDEHHINKCGLCIYEALKQKYGGK